VTVHSFATVCERHVPICVCCINFSALLSSAAEDSCLQLSQALDGAARLNKFEVTYLKAFIILR
jgi:hypothetical protein